MAGKHEATEPTEASLMTSENDRFQLSRQDASVNSRKNPLGRTDELLLELDDDELESAFGSTAKSPTPSISQLSVNTVSSKSAEDVNTEENEPVAPLKRRPLVGLYGLKSPTTTYNAIKINGSIPNGHLNGTVNDEVNGTANGNKLSVYGDHPVVISSVSAPLNQTTHRPVSPSTSALVSSSSSKNHHSWKTASLRNTSAVITDNGNNVHFAACSSPAFRQQTTFDEGSSNTARSLSLKLEVPKREGPRSGASSPQSSHSSSTNCLFNASGNAESTGNHADGEVRLQPSLSTPCPGGGGRMNLSGVGQRKEAEYRRFKSEGSTSGSSNMPPSELEMAINEFSPMVDRSSPPHRLNIFQQDSINGPLAKYSQTEQVMMMHTLKTKLQKYQGFIDKAFEFIRQGGDEQVAEGCAILTKVMTKAWLFPKISHDLAYALCDYLREQNYFDILVNIFIKTGTCDSVRQCCGRVIEEVMSLNNREYVVTKGFLKKLIATAEKLNRTQEQQRISLSIMESMFKHSASTTSKLIDFGVLDHILLTCKRATDNPDTLRYAALALANLSLYSSPETKKKIIQKKLPDWLFLLASQQDDITRYYACLAICMLGSSKEMEAAVVKSGTLSLVEPFLAGHSPIAFATDDYKHAQGRSKEWLMRLLPMLRSKCREAKSIAAFHFTMEATIKKDQQKLEILEEIGAIQALKEVASSPDELAAKFASESLLLIGEEIPYRLSQQVPCWSISDVQCWVEKIGFVSFSEKFAKHMVDGDLLLLLTEKELEDDLEMKSGILRKRFMRELESLKIAADYSSVDDSQLDQFLMSLSPELSVYTYQMLGMGLNRSLLPHLTNYMMKSVCGIQNPIHRLKLRQALQDSKHIEDIEVSILSKQIDIFISYRRSTGNQLASLIKVLLQLRGYKVFIDVDKLYAGKFDSHLLKNIQAAKHFILVLTPHSLDRLLGDEACEDWIHKELRCAFEYQKNVIPIFDQHFEFPAVESELPNDIRQITKFNGVRWVHDYQEACVDKVERFIKGELNRTPSIGPNQNQLSVRPTSATTTRKPSYKLGSTNTTTSRPIVSSTTRNSKPEASGTTATVSYKLNSSTRPANQPLAVRSSSTEKQRRKVISSSSISVHSEK